MAMTAAEMKATARQATIAAIMPSLQENNAIKFADGSFAILQNVEGLLCEALRHELIP